MVLGCKHTECQASTFSMSVKLDSLEYICFFYDFVFKIRLIRLSFSFEKQTKFPYLNP